MFLYSSIANTESLISKADSRQLQEDLNKHNIELSRFSGLLQDQRPYAIALHKWSVYVVDACIAGISPNNLGKTYATLFAEFAQVIGGSFDEEKDLPFFMK